jgi:nucleotide-binding universal stress UspA family protein
MATAKQRKPERLFRRVLVPVDFTSRNRRSLDVAAGIASASRATLYILHVIETLPLIPQSELSAFYRRLEEDARKKLGRLASRLARRGLKVVLETLYGKRAETIIEHASENGIDLVVLSSHAMRPRKPALGLGTISYRVGIASPCSVLLVK